jgi:hypothetical protein
MTSSAMKEREAFEAWAISEESEIGVRDVRAAWKAWQARAALAAPQGERKAVREVDS